MKITVILCTYNRCQHLTTALDSLSGLELSSSIDWEILVVDNNSSDQTREVVEDYCRRFPAHFRYLFEGRQGKSRALNSGIREARGEILAFTDDDVTVEPTWLQNLTGALHEGQWAGAGGRILPDQAFRTPRWVPLKAPDPLAPLAIFDPDREPGPMVDAPYGVNMAYRKNAFDRYGGFRTDLGPGAGGVHTNEDSEFGQRLIAAGERLRYEPSAVVYHAVPEERLQKDYFLNWWFEKARADVRTHGIPADTVWSVAGVPLVLLRRLTMWALRWAFCLEPGQRFGAKINVWTTAGTMLECFRLSRETKGQLNPINRRT
jgi:glucosyl-dolichyl phosphate glucuronosyltransferase